MAKAAYDHLFKILLIGDSGVGKTCIMCRYSHDAFSSNYVSTIGVDFIMKTIELNGQRIKLQIWDTAGQERFQAITASFYRGAMGIMLIYDVTNGQSFDNISRWLRNIDQNASEDVVRMIMGNKSDLAEARLISKEQAEKVAIHHAIPFMETSAKANINVAEAFREIALRILEKQTEKNQTQTSSSSPSSQTINAANKQNTPGFGAGYINCCL